MKTIEIEDMTKEQCFDYLKKKLQVFLPADQIYELVGGRMTLMNLVISDLESKVDFNRMILLFSFKLFPSNIHLFFFQQKLR